MDVTYIIQSLETNNILSNQSISIENPYFLLALTEPCGIDTKYSVIAPSGCDNNWILAVIGTQEIYESLLDGYIYFQETGTWEVDMYYQSDANNIDPDNSTYLTTVKFQVI